MSRGKELMVGSVIILSVAVSVIGTLWLQGTNFGRLPTVVEAPPDSCSTPPCMVELDADEINFAALLLRSKTTQVGFQPRDTIFLDVRPVISPELLPKAPLGQPVAGTFGFDVPPEFFSGSPEGEVAVPLTTFIRALLEGDTEDGSPPNTVAILGVFEPSFLEYASFFGPGSAFEPVLRVILTSGEEKGLP